MLICCSHYTAEVDLYCNLIGTSVQFYEKAATTLYITTNGLT